MGFGSGGLKGFLANAKGKIGKGAKPVVGQKDEVEQVHNKAEEQGEPTNAKAMPGAAEKTFPPAKKGKSLPIFKKKG